MFNFTTVMFEGTSPAFYFTNTSGWNTSSSNVSYKHVSDFGRLRSYDRLKLRREGNDY